MIRVSISKLLSVGWFVYLRTFGFFTMHIKNKNHHMKLLFLIYNFIFDLYIYFLFFSLQMKIKDTT